MSGRGDESKAFVQTGSKDKIIVFAMVTIWKYCVSVYQGPY